MQDLCGRGRSASQKSDQGLHCLLRPVCPDTKGKYGQYSTHFNLWSLVGHLYIKIKHI